MSLSDIFTNTIFNTLSALVSPLPNAPTPVLPIQLTTAFNWVVSSASTWNKVFPLDVAFQVILFIISFELLVWGFKLGIFIYDKIRGSG